MYARSPKGQPLPGLNQENPGQLVKGGDPVPVVCSSESPAGVLHPALEPPAQEGHEAVGAGLEEGHKNYQRAETLLL